MAAEESRPSMPRRPPTLATMTRRDRSGTGAMQRLDSSSSFVWLRRAAARVGVCWDTADDASRRRRRSPAVAVVEVVATKDPSGRRTRPRRRPCCPPRRATPPRRPPSRRATEERRRVATRTTICLCHSCDESHGCSCGGCGCRRETTTAIVVVGDAGARTEILFSFCGGRWDLDGRSSSRFLCASPPMNDGFRFSTRTLGSTLVSQKLPASSYQKRIRYRTSPPFFSVRVSVTQTRRGGSTVVLREVLKKGLDQPRVEAVSCCRRSTT